MTADNEQVACCLGGVAGYAASRSGSTSLTSSLVANGISLPLPALDDEEGAHLPTDLPPVIDGHVHVFPERIARAIWSWFDQYGWPIRYKLLADDVVTHLLTRGVSHVVLLHYAHKPGIARSMNAFVADLIARHAPTFGGRITGLATVHPGEPDQVEVLSDAFAHGLKGVKLHCHVQAMPADDVRLFPVYELCAARGLPVVIHAGREPKSDALPVDPYTICDASRVERVLRQFPSLKLCVPHLGVDELDAYAALLRRCDNLWLDTTMMLGSYFNTGDVTQYLKVRPDRVLFGTDFPHLPYAWDREARAVARAGLGDADVELLLAGNARTLFGIPEIP
jgi:predicted TIM-barrel fold metal-dependent hydrolase